MSASFAKHTPDQPPTAAASAASVSLAASAAAAAAAADGDTGDPQHKRVYQACIPCRRRKVRCDLGSVDNPHDPPCVRCRRESKECFFSATRRKRKGDEALEEYDDEYIIRNGRKRHYLDDTPPVQERRSYSTAPLTPGGSSGRTLPLKRPNESVGRHGSFSNHEDSNAHVENFEAQTVMRKEVFGPHDALDLLYKAATDSPHVMQVPQESASSALPQPSPAIRPPVRPSREQSVSFSSDRRPVRQHPRPAAPVDPRIPQVAGKEKQEIEERLASVENEEGYAEALHAWSRFRFVRAGWFTKEEAIKYIVYYYEFLSPLTPISPPTFRNPGSHSTLLSEEPVLSVTLLTIASRYYTIKTSGGHCRSHAIHEELWRYLRKMIERILWGQEAFGGGFCGSGANEAETSSTAPWRGLRKGSLRTLGTVESLMILTEWHPRALHFPPGEAIDELMLPVRDNMSSTPDEDSAQRLGGGRRIESWLEPAWRSDRMCWMLLSNAMGLAYELGVFDDIEVLLENDLIDRPEYEDEVYRLRATRIKRLLLVYATQLAGRLGWTNMVPESIRKTDPVFSRATRRPASNEGTTPLTQLSTGFSYIPNVELDDQVIQCWVGVSNAMHLGNERLFKSRKHTTAIIQSGKYVELLKEFGPLLRNWWAEFERFNLPQVHRHILTIEYEYVRIYVNSLALQAVVERSTSSAVGNSSSNGYSPRAQNYLGNLPLGHLGGFGAADQEYIKEVVEGSRNLLRSVVEGLRPSGYLQHAPVRTYFRIISGAMFLLKTFALGAPKSDVEFSINLLDQTVDAFRTCIVDDIHLGTRFGDLLESLTDRLRDRFKYAPTKPSDHEGKTSSSGEHRDSTTGELKAEQGSLRTREGMTVPDRTSTPAISATPFDMPADGIPYPPGATSIFGTAFAPQTVNGNPLSDTGNLPEDHTFDPHNEWTVDDEMWYLPPGAGLFQNVGENSNVTMTDQGVNIGGVDLLDYMTMDPIPFDTTMNGAGF
ncbi:RNA polymerase II-specific transcription factor-like protein [Microdochium nivale]|nr:RNA polymerase II-specific transcription factor-like protein [Microdochium nivale]